MKELDRSFESLLVVVGIVVLAAGCAAPREHAPDASVAPTASPDATAPASPSPPRTAPSKPFQVPDASACPALDPQRTAYQGSRTCNRHALVNSEGLDDAAAIGLSPDGRTAYAGGRLDDRAAVWSYDAKDAKAGWGRVLLSNVSGVDGIATSQGVVYVWGAVAVVEDDADIFAAALDAATGDLIWTTIFGGPGGQTDLATAATLANDMLVVAATVFGGDQTGYDAAAVAFDRATGVVRWSSIHDESNGHDRPWAVAVTPDQGTVFLVGRGGGKTGQGHGQDLFASNQNGSIIALDTATGAQRWLHRFEGRETGYDSFHSAATSPDGRHLYVAGSSGATASESVGVVRAVDVATGAQAWTSYSSPARTSENHHVAVESLKLSPEGTRLFVWMTVGSVGLMQGYGLADWVEAWSLASDGSTIWRARHDGMPRIPEFSQVAALSPDGLTFYGLEAEGMGVDFHKPERGLDLGLVAFNTQDGGIRWVGKYHSPGDRVSKPRALVVSPDNAYVYVVASDYEGTPAARWLRFDAQ